MANPVGRPTKLTDEVITEALKYIDECKDTVEHFEGDSGKHWEVWRIKFPTGAGLARKLKVNRSTLYEWAKNSSEFSDILEDMNAEQEDRLLNQGLSGNYNPTLAKLVLGKHGYSEKTETDITTKGESINVPNEQMASDFSAYLKGKK